MTSTQKRKAQRKRAKARDTTPLGNCMPWPQVRQVIFARSGGRCEGCGRSLTLEGTFEGHHRRSRAVRKPHRDCPCNAIALCHSCHAGPDGHNGPERARELGRIIFRSDNREPSEISVKIHGRGRVRLDCDGMYLTAR